MQTQNVFEQVARSMQDLQSPDFFILKNRKAGKYPRLTIYLYQHFFDVLSDAFSVGDLPEGSIVVFKEGDKQVYTGPVDIVSVTETIWQLM